MHEQTSQLWPKNVSNWLKANKISLNVGKTEFVLTSSKKQLECDLRIKPKW